MIYKILNSKLAIRFFEWLYFQKVLDPFNFPCKERIVKVKKWNVFLIDQCHGKNFDKPGQRMTASPVWNWGRVLSLILRMIVPYKPPIPGKYYCQFCERPVDNVIKSVRSSKQLGEKRFYHKTGL